MNRRTADVYSPGYATLFKLDKEDLEEVVKEYPEAEQALKDKAAEILREKDSKGKEKPAPPPKDPEVETTEKAEVDNQKEEANINERDQSHENSEVTDEKTENKCENLSEKSSGSKPVRDSESNSDSRLKTIKLTKNEFQPEKHVGKGNESFLAVTNASTSGEEKVHLRSETGTGGSTIRKLSGVVTFSNKLQVIPNRLQDRRDSNEMYVPSK